MSDKLKKKILNKLLKVYNEQNYAGNTNSELGKSISFKQLQLDTRINSTSLQLVLDSLYYEKYVNRIPLTGQGINVSFSINNKGKDAIVSKKFAWHSYDNILKVAPIIISIIALAISIISLYN